MPIITPTYGQGFARNAAQSEYPELWRGLVGLWSPSLGPTGLTLRDWSGYQKDGTLTNMDAATDWIASEKGWALDYDGSNDSVLISNANELTLVGSDLTVTAWIKMTTNSSFRGIIGNDFVDGWWFNIDDGLIAFFSRGTGAFALANVTGGSVPLNTWSHVAVTWENATKTVNGYYNGIEGISDTVQNVFVDGGNTFYIGIDSRDGLGFAFQGQIGDIAIYDHILSHNEIAQMYAGANPLILRERGVVKVPVTLLAMERANFRRLASRIFGRVN